MGTQSRPCYNLPIWYFLSFFWSALGRRTSEYLDLYNEEALKVETENLNIKNGPFQKAEHEFRTKTKPYQSSRMVVTYGPYCIGILYFILIPISLGGENMMNSWYCIIGIIIGIILTSIIWHIATRNNIDAQIKAAAERGHKEIVKMLIDTKNKKNGNNSK